MKKTILIVLVALGLTSCSTGQLTYNSPNDPNNYELTADCENCDEID